MSNPIQGLPQGRLDGSLRTDLGLKPGTAGQADFMSTLNNAMGQVGDLQTQAEGKIAQLLNGNGQDVHSAMIAVEKANLAFAMMVQVRNKIVQAYQQVSGMQF